MLSGRQDFKVSILGIRRTDPSGGELSHIQVIEIIVRLSGLSLL